MTERIFRFGPEESLLGVLTESEQVGPDTPALLFLNAGTMPHVGPFGWYSTLARRLAEDGVPCFRMDLSGIGESPPRDEPGSAQDRVCVDVTAAMDLLARKRKVGRFVLLGLCSGAVLAHHVAVRDQRVAGAVLLDGYGYLTFGYYLRRYAARAFRLRSWFGMPGRLLRWILPRSARRESGPLLSESLFFDFPPREQVRTDLVELMRRGTQLLFLYTGGVTEHYLNHRRQFAEMFGRLDPGGEFIEVEYDAEADHLYSAHSQRQAMFARIEAWMRRLL
jgi:pimeloyl-ACP methyl ester carboxylesterase